MFSKKRREFLPCVLTSCQTIYLANLNGATNRGQAKVVKPLIFIATMKKLKKNICVYQVRLS